jgi:methyl-accepting chemotaxis protein
VTDKEVKQINRYFDKMTDTVTELVNRVNDLTEQVNTLTEFHNKEVEDRRGNK